MMEDFVPLTSSSIDLWGVLFNLLPILNTIIVSVGALFNADIAFEVWQDRRRGLKRSRVFIVSGAIGAIGMVGLLFLPRALQNSMGPWLALALLALTLNTWATNRKRRIV
ncbi:MAG: hypothetical protein ACRC2U_09730 [Aeromonas sp.]